MDSAPELPSWGAYHFIALYTSSNLLLRPSSWGMSWMLSALRSNLFRDVLPYRGTSRPFRTTTKFVGSLRRKCWRSLFFCRRIEDILRVPRRGCESFIWPYTTFLADITDKINEALPVPPCCCCCSGCWCWRFCCCREWLRVWTVTVLLLVVDLEDGWGGCCCCWRAVVVLLLWVPTVELRARA